jgi:arabinan endo-1,5-alpha-L-arabinosidase
MRNQSMLRYARQGLLAVVLTLGASVAQAPATYTNPVVTPVAADPDVVRAPDGTFYLYATQDDWGDGGGSHLVPVFRSTDLVKWEYAKDAFTAPPSWKSGGGFVWAPDVHYRGGSYYLFYAASLWGDPDPCIGLATSKTPEGPFQDQGKAVFCSQDIGVANSIDPFLFNDPARPVLFWGSFNGIYAIALSPDLAKTVGPKVEIADSRFEGTFIYKKKGYYYFFGSSGSCCDGANSSYTLYVGRSKNLLGPYLDSSGQDLRYGGGDQILSRNEAWVGPGHNSVIADDSGNDWLVYHAMPAQDAVLPNGTNRREGLIDRLEWRNGWPSVNGGKGPSSTPQAAPSVKAKR